MDKLKNLRRRNDKLEGEGYSENETEASKREKKLKLWKSKAWK